MDCVVLDHSAFQRQLSRQLRKPFQTFSTSVTSNAVHFQMKHFPAVGE